MPKRSISELIDRAEIILGDEITDKKQVIKSLINKFNLSKEKEDLLFNSVIQREEMGSTGIGNGIAIPHTRSMVVTEMRIAIARPKNPLDFNSVDKKPVHIVFLIVAPPYSSESEYLILLGKIAEAFHEASSYDGLLSAENREEFKEELCEIFGD